jgi:hypothetical protein
MGPKCPEKRGDGKQNPVIDPGAGAYDLGLIPKNATKSTDYIIMSAALLAAVAASFADVLRAGGGVLLHVMVARQWVTVDLDFFGECGRSRGHMLAKGRLF